MDPAQAAAEILESLTGPEPPGDLNYDEPVVRVFVEERDDVPPGRVAHRDGPVYYYDEPLAPESLDSIYPPRNPYDVAVFEKADGGQWVPYRGPRGGTGWQNAATGEVVYQDEPPGEPVHPNDLLEILEQEGGAPPPDELVSLIEQAQEAFGIEDVLVPDMPDAEGVEALAGRARELMDDGFGAGGAVNRAIEEEIGDLDPPEWAKVHDQVMREVERPELEPTEGDVVSMVVPGRGRIEGVVAYFERRDWGAYVDIRDPETGNDLELELDNEELEQVEVLEEGETVRAWTGEKHPDPVEVTPGDVAEVLFSKGYDSEVENHFWSYLRGMPDGVEGEEAAERALRGALREAGEWEDDYKKIIKAAGREHRFAGNSAPERLDPSRAEKVTDLAETAGNSSTVDSMDLAVMPDGSKVYVTHVDKDMPTGAFHEPVSSARDAEVAVAAAEALKAMGVDVPDHHYEHNRFLAVEDAGGVVAAKARKHAEVDGEALNPNHQQVADALAAQILIGNRDAHPWNFAVVERTRDTDPALLGGEVTQHELVPFDLDLAGHDSSGWEGYNNTMRKAARTLKKVTDDSASVDILAEELKADVNALADRIDPDEVVEAIPDREMRATVRGNIDHWRTYGL